MRHAAEGALAIRRGGKLKPGTKLRTENGVVKALANLDKALPANVGIVLNVARGMSALRAKMEKARAKATATTHGIIEISPTANSKQTNASARKVL